MLKEKTPEFIVEFRMAEEIAICASGSSDGLVTGKYYDGNLNATWSTPLMKNYCPLNPLGV